MVNLSTELYNLFDSEGSHIVNFLYWLATVYGLEGEIDILDVGCGPGRILKPMAERGWKVVAMEPNTEYHAAAVEVARGLDDVIVIGGGFREIEQESAYDIIAAVNAPFAYLTTVAERINALQRAYRALKPGGVLFLDMPNFLGILKNYLDPKPSITQSPTGDLVRREIKHEIDLHDCTFTHIDHFYINGELADTQVHRMSIMTLTEIRYMLAEEGYKKVMTFNGFGARENQRIHGVRLMVSAQKPITA